MANKINISRTEALLEADMAELIEEQAIVASSGRIYKKYTYKCSKCGKRVDRTTRSTAREVYCFKCKHEKSKENQRNYRERRHLAMRINAICEFADKLISELEPGTKSKEDVEKYIKTKANEYLES